LTRAAIAFCLVAAGCVAVACSFNLDPSLIVDTGKDLGPAGGEPGAAAEAGMDGTGPNGLGNKCTTDAECPSSHGCLTGRCDAIRGVCVYDVCKQPGPSCAVARCNEAVRSCGAPTPHGFHAGVIDVGAPLACADATVSKCIAAAYPFVFVLTTTGVRVHSAIDPMNPTPRSVALTGPSFQPAQLVATANRVYFVGPPNGASAQVAWVDVPVDPFTTTLATTAQATLTISADAGTSAFAATADSIFVVGQVAPYPTALVGQAAGATVNAYPLPPVGPYPTLAGASGTRLLVQSTFGGADYRFVLNAGTASATLSADAGSPAAQSMFAIQYGQGHDGSIVAHGGVFGGTYPDFGYSSTGAVWLVANAAATSYGTQAVAVETYTPYASTYPLGPIAWLDPDRVLVTALAAGAAGTTSVQVATKATNPPSKIAGRRFTFPADPIKIGAAASNGLGYVLVSEATTAKLHVFATDCN
jgi:hypothetical protein